IVEIGEIYGPQQRPGGPIATRVVFCHLAVEGEIVLFRHRGDEVALVLEVVVEARQRSAGEPRHPGERGLGDAPTAEHAGRRRNDLLPAMPTARLLELQRPAHGSFTESSSPP